MLEGKRIAILAEEGFEEIELTELTMAMKDIGAMVCLVGVCPGGQYRSRRGEVTVRVDVQADGVTVDDLNAIIVPGLNADSKIHLSQTVVELVMQAHSSAKIIAAIAFGPRLLIAAGIVQGRRLTSAAPIAEDLKKAGAQWIDSPVVRDRNLITARRLVDLPRFCKAIIEAVGVDI